MSKPVPGLPYVIVPGDTLIGIAKKAYGQAREWRKIWKANEKVLVSGDPNLIFPGETIQIPILVELDKLKKTLSPDLPNRPPDEMEIIIDGTEIKFTQGSILRTMDTAADMWTAVLPWFTDDEEISDLLRPFAYREAQAYLGGFKLVDGFLYTTTTRKAAGGITIGLEGYSATIDLVDSTLKPPLVQKQVTLKQRAEEVCGPFGVGVVFEITADPPFKKVTAEPTDKAFDHLAGLASQRGALISSTEDGELLFTEVTTDPPVGSIDDDLPPQQEISAKFDGRGRFNSYKAIGQSPGKTNKRAVAKDDGIPKTRFFTFRADDTTIGDIQKAADWRRSKQVADALTFPLPVSSWYAPDGNLWRENTLVTVKSPILYAPDGFDFLIRSVEYKFTKDGTTAVLSLVPPNVFTGKAVETPWIEPVNPLNF